ncbi:MAG: DUF2065 domain-containing protein [Gammaproteobacteria bacterium]|nr:DUF2065 domain-containing protein [Gammaproteobacteria bacterium]
MILALSLSIILEGMLLFVSPENFRKLLLYFNTFSNNSLRIFGLVCMILGLTIFLLLI